MVGAILCAILVLALALRLYGIDWDQGGLFHPDERAIFFKVRALSMPARFSDLFSASSSTLNPRWFSYGSLPLYLLKSLEAFSWPPVSSQLSDMRIPGRALCAVADVLVVATIFLLARTWLDRRVALLASAFITLAVIHIQLSHFFTPDTLLTLFGTGAIFFLVRVAHEGSRSDSIFGGALVGLALATKASAIVLGAPLVLAHLIYAVSATGNTVVLSRSSGSRSRARRALRNLCLASAAVLIALLVTQPYMFLDLDTYWGHVQQEARMVRRIVDLPYTRQYIDTPSYLYQAWQLAVFGLGPALGILAWLGLPAGVVHAALRRRKLDLVILSWLLPYLLIVGSFDVKFMRYLLPAVPFLLLYGARLAIHALDLARSRREGWQRPVLAGIVLVILLTAHYALAFESIYTRPHPAQAAAAWLSEKSSTDALILQEHWEEGIPGMDDRRREQLELYEPDTDEKLAVLSSQLERGDYLVLYSDRLYGTLPRLPDRYPLSYGYYKALFKGELGYELVRVERSIPQFLGIAYDNDTFARTDIPAPTLGRPLHSTLVSLNLGWADESFSVYDHPKVFVFFNARRLSAVELQARIRAEAPSRQRTVGLMMSAAEAEAQRSGGTFAQIVSDSDPETGAPWLVWILWAQLIGLMALPLCAAVFQRSLNTCYLLSKPLGLLIVAYLTWLMASVGILQFSRESVLVSMTLLLALSVAVGFRRRAALVQLVIANGRLVIAMELLFLAAYLGFVGLRALNPDLWHPFRGGEKPMDFAYLNAVVRSSMMPPFDPWFAGGYINYYYFGHFMVATLIRLTGIHPAIAYNLAIPLLFAFTVGGAFSIVYCLAQGTQTSRTGTQRCRWSPFVAGIAGALLVAVAGNLDGAVQVLEGLFRVVVDGQAFGDFDYWRSSRMFPRDSAGHEITEFPYFTFLFADLHAHLIAMPFALLGLGLAIDLSLRLSAGSSDARELWLSVMVLALTVGALRVTNAWDWPTCVALSSLLLLAGSWLGSPGRVRSALARSTTMAIVMIAVGHLAFLPFQLSFENFYSGFRLSDVRTPLGVYLSIHAPFLLLIASYIKWRCGWRLLKPGRLSSVANVARSALIVTLIVSLAFFEYGTVVFCAILMLGLSMVARACVESRETGRLYELICLALIATGLAVSAGVDVVALEHDLGRMNTVFKFYLQVWVLFAMSSGYILWRFATSGLFSLRDLASSRAAWLAGVAALLASCLVYPILGTRARVVDRFADSEPGLLGTSYMNAATYYEGPHPIKLVDDLGAIRWLQRNVEGSPVIIEGLTDNYRWGNRISVNTGLPAVVGWDWHQRQQRRGYAEVVRQRRRDVDLAYSTDDPRTALRVLRRYDVKYVVVGELERILYPPAGIEKFGKMTRLGLVRVYSNEGTSIFELVVEG